MISKGKENPGSIQMYSTENQNGYSIYAAYFCLKVFMIPGTSWWELQSRCRRCWACWWCSGWLEKLFSDICTESDWCSQRLSCWWWRWRISLDPPWSVQLIVLLLPNLCLREIFWLCSLIVVENPCLLKSYMSNTIQCRSFLISLLVF